MRQPDGSISRTTHRKGTWTGQYLHFESFVPIEYKRGLVRTLFDRARKICTSDKIENELELIKETLVVNGYPESFINKHSQPKIGVRTAATTERLKVTICLPFKGDDVGCLFKRRLRPAIARTYYAANPNVVYRTTKIPTPPVKERPSLYAQSNLIYEFHFGCGATYVGRTERQLSNRLSEHMPHLVQRQVAQTQSSSRIYKTPTSSIARHILATGHHVDPEKAFRAIYTTENSRLLSCAEATAINRWKPPLCQQKELFISLQPPW